MIVIMKPNACEEAVKRVTGIIESKGLTAHLSKGDQVTIIGVVGDKTRLYGSNIEITDGVDKVVSVTESYKLANKKFHPEPSVIKVQNTEIGPKTLTVMAGPCAIESSSQLMETAFAVKKSGATFLRGGAYKPRTSPYSFQGLETEGLKYMKEAREATGLSVICEVTSGHAIQSAVQYVPGSDLEHIHILYGGYAPDRSQEHAEFRTFKRSRKNFPPHLTKTWFICYNR